MTYNELAVSYVRRAQVRFEALQFFLEREAYPDVVREAQELAELALKGLLRSVGIDPPRWHDVGPVLRDQAHLFSASLQKKIPALAQASGRLRRDREMAFYGDVDFIPGDHYGRSEAEAAIADAGLILQAAQEVVLP